MQAAGFFCILSIFLGLFVNAAFFVLLFLSLIFLLFGLLYLICKIYIGDDEIIVSLNIVKKATLKKSDMKEILVGETGNGVFIFLCFNGVSNADENVTLSQYRKLCKANPAIKLYTLEYQKKLLTALLTDFNGRLIADGKYL